MSTNLAPFSVLTLCSISFSSLFSRTQQLRCPTLWAAFSAEYATSPSQTKMIEFQPCSIGILNQLYLPSQMSMQQEGVLYLTGPTWPSQFPQIIFTLAPSFQNTGIWSLVSSWYLGSIIFSLALKLSQSCRPIESSSLEAGISACTIPFPAVIHWISPGPITPLCPLKSS